MNVPKLRFKEFSDEWKKAKLSSFVNINPKNNSLPDKFIYIDLESVNNGLLTSRKIVNKSEAPSRAQRTIIKNDILYQTVRPYQMNNLFINSLDSDYPYIASTGYALLRTKENPYFVYSILYQKSFVNKVLDMCTGTSYPAISANDLGTISICLPSIKEQEKIGKTLSLLEKKIELQTKKIEDLKLFKLYLQNKLYNANDTKDVLIKDLGEIVTGTTPSKSENKYWDNGNILWITPTDICENRNINDCSCKLTESGLAKGRFIPKNSILVTCIASIGKNAIIKEDGSCNQQINAIIPSKDYNYNYIYYMIENLSNYMKSIAGTSATAIINKEQFGNINIKIHKRKVQDKISKILNAFETKIIQEGFKYKKLQNLKKGLMQNMFV